MARKTATVTITADGRDKGKAFLLTEMSAAQAERWGMRALAALGKSSMQVPEEIVAGGVAVMAQFALHAVAGASFIEIEPLLDEMFACVSIIPNPSRPEFVRALVDDDIEEVATRIKLRGEVIELHTGFSIAAFLSKKAASDAESVTAS